MTPLKNSYGSVGPYTRHQSRCPHKNTPTTRAHAPNGLYLNQRGSLSTAANRTSVTKNHVCQLRSNRDRGGELPVACRPGLPITGRLICGRKGSRGEPRLG